MTVYVLTFRYGRLLGTYGVLWVTWVTLVEMHVDTLERPMTLRTKVHSNSISILSFRIVSSLGNTGLGGGSEGRTPSACVSTKKSLDTNPDLRIVKKDPEIKHWINVFLYECLFLPSPSCHR